MEDYQIELVQMMEMAGRNLAHLAREIFLDGDPRDPTVVVLAGIGVNGGGAMVCTRRLYNYGASVAVYVTKPDDELAPVPAHQLDILRRMGVAVAPAETVAAQHDADLVIDAQTSTSELISNRTSSTRSREHISLAWMARELSLHELGE